MATTTLFPVTIAPKNCDLSQPDIRERVPCLVSRDNII